MPKVYYETSQSGKETYIDVLQTKLAKIIIPQLLGPKSSGCLKNLSGVFGYPELILHLQIILF